MKKIYIFGAGYRGKIALDILNKEIKSAIEGVWDLFKEGEEFLKYIISSPREISEDSIVIIAISDENSMIDMYEKIYELGIRNIYWFNGEKKIYKGDFINDMCIDCCNWGENIVKHIEINLADHCNLNCKCCSHFSALFEPHFPSVDELVADIMQLKKKFSHILNFYLMGGEPLLNKEIDKIIVKVRELLPLSKIVIVTNGILLTKLDKAIFSIIKENNIHIDISEYTPTKKLIPSIKLVLDEFEISYTIKKMKSDSFYKLLSLSDNSIYKKGCLADGCYDVWKGQIAKCPMLMYLDKFNESFGINLPREGVIDIYSEVSGKDLKKMLKKRVPLCDHCITKKVVWEQCGRDIELSDFAEWR